MNISNINYKGILGKQVKADITNPLNVLTLPMDNGDTIYNSFSHSFLVFLGDGDVLTPPLFLGKIGEVVDAPVPEVLSAIKSIANETLTSENLTELAVRLDKETVLGPEGTIVFCDATDIMITGIVLDEKDINFYPSNLLEAIQMLSGDFSTKNLVEAFYVAAIKAQDPHGLNTDTPTMPIPSTYIDQNS